MHKVSNSLKKLPPFRPNICSISSTPGFNIWLTISIIWKEDFKEPSPSWGKELSVIQERKNLIFISRKAKTAQSAMAKK